VSGSSPEYPTQAREQGLEGYVVVRYDVGDGGRVRNAQVIQADPSDIFDAAALQAVTSWVFKPALINGVPQAQQGRRSTVTFKLGSGSEYADY
jgi:protein TonB